MAIFDDIDRKKVLQARTDEDRLARLGREWFTEAQQKSQREDAEFSAWNRERKKWTSDAGDGGWLDWGGGDGGGDGGGGGD